MLEKRTADYVIGESSLYGRRNSPGVATRSEGSITSGFAYDDVYHRLFVRDGSVNAWGPNGRVLIFDVHPERIENGIEATAVIGQPDFTSRSLGGIGRQKMGSIDQEALDEKNQRLFLTDRANNRVMVWDVHPDRLTETPEAMAVLGQSDFKSKEPGSGPAKFNRPGDLYYDEESDRLFVTDMGNNRILVFNAAPGRLETGMAAAEVLGQPDFQTTEPGTAADRFATPSELAYDHRFDRLFVADSGNRRLLVFDDSANGLRTGTKATHVLGQPDFTTRKPNENPKKWAQGLILDEKNQRLFANEGDRRAPGFGGERMLVFDIHPDRLRNNPDATNLLFEEDWESGFGPTAVAGLGIVSRTEETSARPFLDDETEMLYVATSYTGRNAVSFWDVSPGNMKETGTPAADVLGQYDWAGNADFDQRAAFGRQNDRFIYPRGTALDPVDHRLFVNDQYLHRVLVFDLDDDNRPLDRKTDIILGQPDAFTGDIRQPTARNLNVPLSLAYDSVGKQLFVADGGNNRIMVFDADPNRLDTFDEAVAVLGQRDFASRDRGASSAAIDFGVSYGRGITSTNPLPMGFAVDEERRRLFVSDGNNHRVLIYDISAEEIETGMAAKGVIGQPDFESNAPTPDLSARQANEGADTQLFRQRIVSGRRPDSRGFDFPSGLAYDPDHARLFVVDGNNSRVLVFDAAPGAIGPGQEAIAVLGQKDFTTGDELRLDTTEVSEDVGRRRMRMPSGVAYDRVREELYVNDKGNDRILVFDAAPDELESGMAAKGVIGQPDFVSRLPGYGEQEQLLDPRQLAFDAEYRRLYVPDSFWGRLTMFDLPRSERAVAVAGHGMKTYGTIDAWNNRPQPDNPRLGRPKADVRQAWRGVLEGTGGLPGATLVYHNTRQEFDPLAKRRSRILISETSMMAPAPRPSSLYFVLEGDDTHSRVVVSNPNAAAVRVAFRLQLENGAPGGWLSRVIGRAFGAGERLEVVRTLEAGARLEATMRELFDREIDGIGTLRVAAADAAVASLMLYQTTTSRGEELLLAGPDGAAPEAGETVALSGLKWGGGYRSELVLLNPHEKTIAGTVAFFDREGAPVAVAEGSPRFSYEISPEGVFRWAHEAASTWPEAVYAVIDGDDALPTGGAVVSRWKGALMVTQTMIPVRATTHHAWVPVDTEPSLIRHGHQRMTFTLANPTRTPATLRLTLFDGSGAEKGRYEQLLPPHGAREWSLADFFNVRTFRGSVRLWSDVPVAVNATRNTESLRGEPVADHIAYLTAEDVEDQDRVELPSIIDGEGLATEIMFLNPAEAGTRATWRFLSADGQPKEIVLR